MPKFSSFVDSAIEPIRITPDMAKNQRLLPMKSKCPFQMAVARAQHRGAAQQLGAPHRAEDRLREQHRGEQRDQCPDTEGESESLHSRRREHEQDEGRDQRDDVRVDDRRDAALVSVAIAESEERPARSSSLIRSKMTMFESAAIPIVRIRPAMPGCERDGYQLDQPVEEDAVRDQREARDHAQQAVEAHQEDQDEPEADGAGQQALAQRLLAGEAETCVSEIGFRSIGSAPVFRTSARSCASWSLKPPEIWAPVRPSIPSGFSR